MNEYISFYIIAFIFSIFLIVFSIFYKKGKNKKFIISTISFFTSLVIIGISALYNVGGLYSHFEGYIFTQKYFGHGVWLSPPIYESKSKTDYYIGDGYSCFIYEVDKRDLEILHKNIKNSQDLPIRNLKNKKWETTNWLPLQVFDCQKFEMIVRFLPKSESPIILKIRDSIYTKNGYATYALKRQFWIPDDSTISNFEVVFLDFANNIILIIISNS